MNKQKALNQLKETRQLSTALLKPLDVTFEQFLRLGQWPAERQEQAIDRLIAREEKKVG